MVSATTLQDNTLQENSSSSSTSYEEESRKEGFAIGNREKSATAGTIFVSEADISNENVVLKRLEDVREPSLDPRVQLSPESIPDDEELDEGLGSRLSRALSRRESRNSTRSEEFGKREAPIYVGIFNVSPCRTLFTGLFIFLD